MNTYRYVAFFFVFVLVALLALPANTYAAPGKVVITAEGKLKAAFTNKHLVKLAWSGSGVKDCKIYFELKEQNKVPKKGKKIVMMDDKPTNVSIVCEDIATGDKVNSRVIVASKKGDASFKAMVMGTSVRASVNAVRPAPFCKDKVIGPISWGDGTTSSLKVTDSGCDIETYAFKDHSYAKPGTYTVTFADWLGKKHEVEVEIK